MGPELVDDPANGPGLCQHVGRKEAIHTSHPSCNAFGTNPGTRLHEGSDLQGKERQCSETLWTVLASELKVRFQNRWC